MKELTLGKERRTRGRDTEHGTFCLQEKKSSLVPFALTPLTLWGYQQNPEKALGDLIEFNRAGAANDANFEQVERRFA